MTLRAVIFVLDAVVAHSPEQGHQNRSAVAPPEDSFPGFPALLELLDQAVTPYASWADIDPGNVLHPTTAPDSLRSSAARMDVPVSQCLVVGDSAAAIEAAGAAGMAALAIGPAARYEALLGENSRVARRDGLAGLTVEDLSAFVEFDRGWTVRQTEFEPAKQHHMETVFTSGNGYFASRGSFEEGFPGDRALTLAHGVFNDVPVYFTELVNLPDWMDIRLSVDGQQFRLDQGRVLFFDRVMDLRHGFLRREVRWQAPNGAVLDLSFERFASYPIEHVGALRVLVTAVNRACDIEIVTGINVHVVNENHRHWRYLDQGHSGDGLVWLHAVTDKTGIEVGMAATVEAHGGTVALCNQCPGHPQFTMTGALEPGRTLDVRKLVSICTSRDAVGADDAVVARAEAAIQGLSYAELHRDQKAAWRHLWDSCDVVIEGDEEAQLATRFNLFQLLIAAPQNDDRASIGAKTLSGLGYRGHVFWDTEVFVLPFFIHAEPELARNMLMYRYHTLAGARAKAERNGFLGAQFSWESAATGEETTPTWIQSAQDSKQLNRVWTGDIQIHISADIAYAVMQYWRITGDDEFVRDYGAELILDTARFWGSRAEYESVDGGHRYAIRNVMGPDEYHEHIDNNTYTNFLARWHLQTAIDVLEWLGSEVPEKARQLRSQLKIDEASLVHWQDIIDNMVLLQDEESRRIDQFEGFFELEEVSSAFIASAEQSIYSLLGIARVNQLQVLKQPDVIMLLCLFRDYFDQKAFRTNWDIYMPKTDHVYGSSLGPSFHAWAACEIGMADEAYKHFMLAARADLQNPRGNAGDGIHAASAGGVWQAIVFGFAGLRTRNGSMTVAPQLPFHWQRIAFKYSYRGRPRSVDIQREGEEYRIRHE